MQNRKARVRHLVRATALAALLTASTHVSLVRASPLPSPERQPNRAATASDPAPASASGPSAIAAARPSPADAAYFAAMDRAIAAARDHAPSAEDATRLKDVVAAVGRDESDAARDLSRQIADPATRVFADWYRLRAGLGEIAEIRRFLTERPGWPDADDMVARIEEKLLAGSPSPAEVQAVFRGREPATGAGAAALARARLATGDRDGARVMVRRAWTDTSLSADEEAQIIRHLGELLSPSEHKLRLDHLLMHDARWTSSRNQRAVVVRRLIPLLPEADRKVAAARLAVFLRTKNAGASLKALPPATETDWGLAFHKAQAARRADRHAEARALLMSAPTDAARAVVPDAWWDERRASAYAALEQGNAKAAYALVKDAGPLSANPRKEQAFLAGWLALRYLSDPKAAAAHFADMLKAVDGPLSTAKARYWSGRAAEALGRTAQAREHYAAAARFPDTFHGQLGLAKTSASRPPFAFSPPAVPSPTEVSAFGADLAVRAAVVAHKAGLVGPARTFLFHLVRVEGTTEARAAMLAHLAEALGDTQAAVRIGKAAIARGHNLVVYAYPTHPMPAYTPLRDPPEPAFLLAIARQESEFNTSIVSGAGARGLLQVMPITARHVCNDYKIRCEIPRLLADRAYNAKIASAYIADRMDDFDGSYVLTLAGYNAGPGRARQWIRQFGDPRDPKVDPIDWIERIPFEETREYVGKVLSNIQVYRARLGDEAGGLRLMDDLMRGRGRSPVQRSAGP